MFNASQEGGATFSADALRGSSASTTMQFHLPGAGVKNPATHLGAAR